MAKIVINIPDYMLNQIMIGCPFKLPSQFVTETYKIIRNGKILPKGHGRLIDEKILLRKLRSRNFGFNLPTWVKVAIDDTPTIIEADKEG